MKSSPPAKTAVCKPSVVKREARTVVIEFKTEVKRHPDETVPVKVPDMNVFLAEKLLKRFAIFTL